MAVERTKGDRVVFERGLAVQICGIDGSWQRDCTLDDVSESGAKLTVSDTPDEAALKEFFLLLSSTGLAYRRCELAWLDGDQVGANFVLSEETGKKLAARGIKS
jgi:hypothetical protein